MSLATTAGPFSFLLSPSPPPTVTANALLVVLLIIRLDRLQEHNRLSALHAGG